MPYVPEVKRARLNEWGVAVTAGELNFQVTSLLIEYLNFSGLSYGSINDVVGALESCKAEFQRRVVAPYEDGCIAVNGDVYPEHLTTGRPNR